MPSHPCRLFLLFNFSIRSFQWVVLHISFYLKIFQLNFLFENSNKYNITLWGEFNIDINSIAGRNWARANVLCSVLPIAHFAICRSFAILRICLQRLCSTFMPCLLTFTWLQLFFAFSAALTHESRMPYLGAFRCFLIIRWALFPLLMAVSFKQFSSGRSRWLVARAFVTPNCTSQSYYGWAWQPCQAMGLFSTNRGIF